MGRHQERAEFINSITFKNKAKKQFKKLDIQTQKEVAKSLGMLIVPTLVSASVNTAFFSPLKNR